MEEVIIIGGGIAGLTCLNALLDKGISPLLLEASRIGTPKMCGEFLAPSAVYLLQEWGLSGIQEISQAQFYAGEKKFTLNFPKMAGAVARSAVELALAERAKAKGGRIRENSLIKNITPASAYSDHLIHLASGEEISVKTLMMATGKFSQQEKPVLKYVGIKLHFPAILESKSLSMHSIKRGYFGIVPISNEWSNLTCILKAEQVKKSGKEYFQELLYQHPRFQALRPYLDHEKTVYLEAQAPEFGRRNFPNWPQTFWLGDAAAAPHPAIGSGFSHGIEMAISAASAYCQNSPSSYHKNMRKSLAPKLHIGKTLHQLFMRPRLASLAIQVCMRNTGLVKSMMKNLGYL